MMKINTRGLRKNLWILAAAALVAPAMSFAGTTSAKAPVTVAPPEEPFVTGSLSVTYDTHFVSWGQDIWAAGNSWKDSLIHPNLELDFNLGGGLQAYFNTWWDINDLAQSSIGNRIQEVDVNVGLYYTMGKTKFQLGYGSWNYASQTEHIIDGKVSYTGFYGLNPWLALHGRVADGIPLSTGLVTQLGIAPGFKVGPVDFSVPIAATADTDNFHGGKAGFGYVSVGLTASVPLSKHVSFGVGVTYYHTNGSVIVNPTEDFVTGSATLGVSF